MRLIRYFPKQSLPGCVATIGNFDGFHKGHQRLLSLLKEKSQTLNLPSLVMSFYPLPQEFLQPGQSNRIMDFYSKFRYLEAFGIDYFACQRFNEAFAQMSAETFVQVGLVKALGVQHLIVGQDFRFGRFAQGDIELLKVMGHSGRFTVDVVPDVYEDHEKISSTQIRQVLENGDLQKVQSLLGRPYSLTARVQSGKAMGRTLGFPTANLAISPSFLRMSGVYCCFATVGERRHPAVANVGYAPTLNGQRKTVEVHILDFDQNIYGERLTVEFMHKLRDEKKFPSLSELIAGIKHDIMLAKAYFADVAPHGAETSNSIVLTK